MSDVKPIPDNYPRVSPYLCIDGASDAIDFYTAVFGATERGRIPMPGDKIGHAELELGGSLIMVADEYPEGNVFGPRHIGGTPVSISVFVEDVDATFTKAIAGGATEIRPVEDQFYGDRMGQFEDPWGHKWSVSSHLEDVSPEEMARRSAEMFGE